MDAPCNIASTQKIDQSDVIRACINSVITNINTNAITPINAYGNPTC